MSELGLPGLDDYQYRLVNTVRNLIANNFFRKLPHLKILDAGCDTSGKQMCHLGSMTTGEVLGINSAENFPSEASRRYARKNVTLVNMDGMNLEFPDQSFDLVISANVMEHVQDPKKYINECCRVLKNSGIAYFETAPLWNSARGHHIHEDMVQENCPEEQGYRNDGSIIPDWAHLVLNEGELRSVLQQKLLPQTCDYILWYLYRSDDLNKCPWSVIKTALENAFGFLSISPWENKPIASEGLEIRKEGSEVFGFSAVCRKKRQSAISRHLIWRLRSCGL